MSAALTPEQERLIQAGIDERQYYYPIPESPCVTTLNEELGTLPSILDAAGDSAWVIRHRGTNHLHTIAANRRTAEHIVNKKAAEYGGSADDYIVEVWHIMQTPEDYDDE